MANWRFIQIGPWSSLPVVVSVAVSAGVACPVAQVEILDHHRAHGGELTVTWYLCAYTRHEDVPVSDQDGIHLTLERLRVIEPDELEVLRGGIALFADLLDRQPLASVLTSRVDVEQAVARP